MVLQKLFLSTDFSLSMDFICLQLGFKMYLGITPVISNWSPAGDEFSLLIENNPLIDFVELPDGHNALNYSNILCGVLKGALEMVNCYLPLKTGAPNALPYL